MTIEFLNSVYDSGALLVIMMSSEGKINIFVAKVFGIVKFPLGTYNNQCGSFSSVTFIVKSPLDKWDGGVIMLNILYRRRSIRKYKTTGLDPETVQKLLQAALLSPSSKGHKPWEFVVIENPEILKQLALAKKGAGFLKSASLGIVILADPATSDVWVEDAAIAATILHLTAESLGLGSCWIQIRKRQFSETESCEEYVRRIVGIPENLKVASIIAVGYSDESKPPYTESNLKFDKVYFNKYGSKFYGQ